MKKCGLVFLAAVSAVVIGTCPAALAISRPHVDPTVPPPSGKPVPAAPMERRGDCTTAGVLPGSNPGQAAPSQTMLDLPAAWKLSRGEGQLVAIIDTGVRRGPRLPNVDPGGDYVETTDGLTDCDGHGTLVAGIVAGQPGNDGFSGVAPAARLVSIRGSSAKFSVRGSSTSPRSLACPPIVASTSRPWARHFATPRSTKTRSSSRRQATPHLPGRSAMARAANPIR
jgi:membrane-anchored mycosin MYCP